MFESKYNQSLKRVIQKVKDKNSSNMLDEFIADELNSDNSISKDLKEVSLDEDKRYNDSLQKLMDMMKSDKKK
ncbi:hypothetical protein [Candidatus Deianiraea vastatrix]|uniref:Uncharacterized protein n=1 Tax=Candidatus Deianiraea vastatrix TaxID=2163644 RepID=A0A5B8XFW0_9RICK|nr:hypothetical protein [Candidatus Deianiraea vastatrix]QED23809.1 hypothetical protein Deia_01027 [Candidatus Deianiraea vastatrix]